MTTSGSITFDRTGDILGPDTPEQSFADSPAAARAAVHHGPSLTAFTLADHQINGARFRAVITFSARRLARIELCLHLPNDSSGWAGWSLENELHRKRAHELWAERTFSAPLKVRVPDGVELADAARRAAASPGSSPPSWLDPDDRRAAMHARPAWGEIISLYDDRAASATLRINYNPAS